MMRIFLCGLSSILLLLTPASAQIRKFPYQGVVESDAAYVRSGPGKQFYPTLRLDRGSRVSVHRHDPGGWYMIAPPAESFSWVRAEYVQKTAANRGLITENNVIVRVGSSFGDETREVEQVRLSKNDQVKILAEKTLETPAGPVLHFKIAPPTGEYRWISGKYITPIDQIVREQQDQNPFAVPSTVKPKPPAKPESNIVRNSPNVFESSQNSAGETAVLRRGPDPALLAAQRDQLEMLDAKFREMVNGRTQDWNFTALEQGYRQLQEAAALEAMSRQIDLRFAAIGRYQTIKSEYDELMKLTTQTRQRDAQLMSIQKQEAAPVPSPPAPPFADEPLVPTPDPFTQTPRNGPEPVELPGLEPIPENPPAAGPPPGNPSPPARPGVPRFDGAGIVQKAAAAGTGTPAYVLVTPQGRVLAYLQPANGLNLEAYVGKAMGIYGQRSFRPELRLDMIVVRSLTPVRLAP